MANPNAQFKIDTSSYLGLSYNEYRDDIYSMAIGNPSDYFKMRKEVVTKIKNDAISQLYNTIFSALSEGQDKDGNPLSAYMVDRDRNELFPRVPPVKINEISLSAAKTLSAILEEVTELIVPLDYKSLSASRLALKGESDTYSK